MPAKKSIIGMVERFPWQLQNCRIITCYDNRQDGLACLLFGELQLLISNKCVPQPGADSLQYLIGYKEFPIGVGLRELSCLTDQVW